MLFLSNGEIALEDKIREGGGRIAAGIEVRVIDLRADAGAGRGCMRKPDSLGARCFKDVPGRQSPGVIWRVLAKPSRIVCPPRVG